MRSLARSFLLMVLAAACGDDGNGSNGDGGLPPLDACAGLGCQQVTCTGGGTTSISGTVFAPNGTLPLYNATVYVPNGPVGALSPGAQCDRCGDTLSGDPLVQTATDTMGRFTLENMPVGRDIPVVIQIGKWRRQIVVPQLDMCVDTPLVDTLTRLPKNQSEGDIPLMALTTGGADSLECLLRKIGLDDAEFTPAGGQGKVHLFTGSGGTPRFAPGLNGGAAFTDAQGLWDTVDHLRTYDVVFLSCEGGQNPDTKPVTARQAMYDYAGLGGRVFMSHWHNYWGQEGPGLLPSVATFNFQADLGNVTADIDTSFTRGADLAQWLVNVAASSTLGKIDLTDSQHTIDAVSLTRAERWISVPSQSSIQYLQFTTPLEAEATDRCGKEVLSDIHVSTGDDSSSGVQFPNGCTTTGLTPQEKVLAFMIFDIASCVGPPIGKVVPGGVSAP
jgi:hypothetical protein